MGQVPDQRRHPHEPRHERPAQGGEEPELKAVACTVPLSCLDLPCCCAAMLETTWLAATLLPPTQVLVDDAKVAGWVREGLPADPTSVENGAILTNSGG